MRTKKIICLYGGPGTGKSTTCAGLFYFLKMAGYDCEMNREYVKEWIWEGRDIKHGDQTYFFAKQARRERLYISRGLDFIITDSPLVLTHFYGMKYDPVEQKYNTSLAMLKNHHGFCKDNGYKVEHFFLNRGSEYNQSGRIHTEDEAIECDEDILDMLDSLNIKYHDIDVNDNTIETILSHLSIKI